LCLGFLLIIGEVTCVFGGGNYCLFYLWQERVMSEVITKCNDKNCPMFGRVHFHCPCCGETLVVKLEDIDDDWPFPEDYRFTKRQRCNGTTW
jgi:hypothetical protein